MTSSSLLTHHCLRALDSAPVGMAVVDARQPGLPVIFANRECAAITGFAVAELTGRPLNLLLGPAGDSKAMDGLCRHTRHRDAVQRIELEARRADGGRMWLLASTRRFSVAGQCAGEDDGHDHIVLVLQDVTEIRLREQRLTEANEEAERNIRARMRFLAAASHDLRQPLQAMALFASALDHHITSTQGHTIVQSLKTALRGMEEMFDSLLDMSKLDAGVMKSEPRVFMVNDVLEQLEATYAPQAEAAGLRLTVVPSSAAVLSDPRLLARILGNFLSNAIRYTRRGGVVVGARRRGQRLLIAVHDTGPGIPESQRLDIFREFRQGANTVGRGEGMGLGLSIVQRLARLLGHGLDVRSVVGRGSTFAVELPLAEDQMPTIAEPEDEDCIPDLSGATVAVIDDDPDIQSALAMLLGEWGCHPVVADSADEALAQLSRQGRTPDVILADLHLGDRRSGLDAVAALRQSANGPVPALLFTGDTSAAVDLPQQPDLRILRKPLHPVRLRILLGQALGRF